MWCHLGRVAAEYPHLHRFSVDELDGLIELVGRAHLDEAKHSAAGGIFFSGHIGNWEVAARAPEQTGVPLTAIYRAANNPIVDRMIERYRGVVAQHRVPKGTDGAREIVRALGAGNHAALLVDQKFNTGIPVPFFGRDAMTAPAVASLALKYGCPVWPVRVERLAGTSFRVTVYPKLAMPQEGTREERIRAIMVAINRILEDWIRERPEQWLWLHPALAELTDAIACGIRREPGRQARTARPRVARPRARAHDAPLARSQASGASARRLRDMDRPRQLTGRMLRL